MTKCWFYKLRAFCGHAIDEHAKHCPACQRDVAELRGLEKRLREETVRAEAPFGFTRRVLVEVDRRQEAPKEYSPMLWGRLAVGSLLTLLGLGMIYKNSNSNRPEQISIRPAETTLASEPLLAELPRFSPDQITQLTVKLDQPLETELQNVISDTRLAIQFVASNFVPEER